MTLECADYIVSPSIRVIWTLFKGSVRSVVPATGRFIQNGSHITIRDVEVGDTGRYECLTVDLNEEALSRRENTLIVIGKYNVK